MIHERQLEPKLQTVLDGRVVPRETDVDTEPSIPTAEPAEEIQFIEISAQDSDDTAASDFSSLNSQPPSLDHHNSQPSEEDNEGIAPIHGDETDCHLSVEEEHSHREESEVHVETSAPTECEDNNTKPVVVVAGTKAGKNYQYICIKINFIHSASNNSR